MKRNSQQGVALVITLILLSVITFMAVTFLVVSRREGAQVNTLTQQSSAKFAADTALEQAKAMIVAQMLSTTNAYNFGLVVSTNYIRQSLIPSGQAGSQNFTNVSYNGVSGINNLELLMANLAILPRAPVFIQTNTDPTKSLDFRFYLDLNRNGVYDTNGWIVESDPVSGALSTNYHVGDPEWIGVLNHPDQRHSGSNQFSSRWCYIAMPIGNSLDANAIHNESLQLGPTPTQSPAQDGGYLRNQGVGSWEINLAGFLAGLNTNVWGTQVFSPLRPYRYNTATSVNVNTGSAFDDAAALVQYRYNKAYGTLNGFAQLYGARAANVFGSGYIDGYSRGSIMTNIYPGGPYFTTGYSGPWSGADNANAIFTSQDLFANIPVPGNPPLPLQSFSNHLLSAGENFNHNAAQTTFDSYNRYTFYRMLSQLSFGSAPETAYPYSTTANTNFSRAYPNAPKMNLNFNNIGTNDAFGNFHPLSATNFVPWTATGFFTNAADRMLRAYFPNPIVYQVGNVLVTNFLSVNNIPIYPVNFYTPAVHRIMQLAANMYDASTNKTGLPPNDIDYPSVFAPYFKVTNGAIISIAGYNEVTNFSQVIPGRLNVLSAPVDLRRATDVNGILALANNSLFGTNIYGVPYVIGVKQGFPHFNRFASAPVIDVWRTLEFVKPTGGQPGQTNILYTIGISNEFGVDCWNPYTTNYPRIVNFMVTNDYTVYLTNNLINFLGTNQISKGSILFPPFNTTNGFTNVSFPVGGSAWTGSPNLRQGPPSGVSTASFKVPLLFTAVPQPESYLRLNPPQLLLASSAPPAMGPQVTGPGYFVPHWGLNITNRIRVMMVDPVTQRLIDYVQLGGLSPLPGLDSFDDINGDLVANSPGLWSTSPVNSKANTAPVGIWTQVSMAEGGIPPSNSVWQSIQPPLPLNSINAAISNFVTFLQDSNQISKQVPFVVATKFEKVYSWSANDPFVHYTIGDLTDPTLSTNPIPISPFTFSGDPLSNNIPGGLRSSSITRYQPWSFTGNNNGLSDVRLNQLSYKDSLISYADQWQFPSNRFPTIGWLGRVHRGTPWQTVYLKSSFVSSNAWANWTGDTLGQYFGLNYPSDSALSQPTNDWLLMDLFTTSPNENASRGQLSVNQTNLAAWQAVLAGVPTIQNLTNGLQAKFIDPGDFLTPPGGSGPTNAIQYIVSSINAMRNSVNPTTGVTNFPGGVFTSAGQLLSVPQLTVASPYINPTNVGTLSDAVYERIPQEIMSLVRLGTPRYVIFAYGQSLKPADHSIITTGPFIGMCTNYQITGEVEARAVVRFDNFPVPGQKTPAAPRAVVESFNVLPPE